MFAAILLQSDDIPSAIHNFIGNVASAEQTAFVLIMITIGGCLYAFSPLRSWRQK